MTAASITAFFDEDTYTVSYVVADMAAGRAAVIDSVLDYDPASGRTATRSADTLCDFIESRQLQLDWILETHVHADHLTAAPYIRDRLGGTIGIGQRVSEIQQVFKGVFNLRDLATDGAPFGQLFADEETFAIGDIPVRVMHTPGHTPACVCYVIGDAAFVGDTLFMPDFGSARTDFPGGSADELYTSIRKILTLPEDTRLFMCHDYKAPGRDEYAWETTVREQRDANIHVNDSIGREQFVAMREQRDSQLGMPRLLLPSIQVNVRAGELPAAEDNDIRYLKIPLDAV